MDELGVREEGLRGEMDVGVEAESTEYRILNDDVVGNHDDSESLLSSLLATVTMDVRVKMY